MYKIMHPSYLEMKIEDSHKRCIKMGVDKEMKTPARIITEKKLQNILKKNSQLINIALPYMKLLREFLKGTGFLIDLADSNGCIISIIGDDEILNCAAEMGMYLGTDMSEKSCGTNSIGTALFEKCPIQMAGEQHYINIYQIWTCSCAPICNTKGHILGALNVTGLYNSVHPHTLGFVSTTAELIENELKSLESKQVLYHITQLNETIVNAVDFGLLSIGKSGSIQTTNRKACEIFACSKERLLNTSAKNLFSNWQDIICVLERDGIYSDEEYVNNNNDKKKKFNINAYPVKDINDDLTDIVVTMKDMKNIYKLVNKYTGKNAYYSFDNIIGNSLQLKEIIEYARTVSKTPSTIIIQGESGTGKEIFAQAIHNESYRSHEPFIAINCGAIPRNLIESELFGYENGAFTSARAGGMPGKFELAQNGTIFLDEIAEMPMDMQVNLLRVLQEKNITRIGGTKSVPIDVRVIVATNKSLIEEVKDGNFREDLYYRLNVIPIYIPPLRERKEDIRPLTAHFLERKAEKLGKDTPELHPDDYKLLFGYQWPGNVRELENTIESYVINGKLNINRKDGRNFSNQTKRTRQNSYNRQSLSEWEKIAIKECLIHCKGNISKTASYLKIDRSTLYKKMRKYSITS